VKCWLKRVQNSLVAGDEVAEAYVQKIPMGEFVEVDIRRPRNVQFHRKFFALLHVVFHNQERYEDFEAFRKEVTMRCGWWREHHHVTGKISYEAKSIAFHKMDEIEFAELYEKAISVILEHFIPGIDVAELEREVREFGA
jgi:hypothetical protein